MSYPALLAAGVPPLAANVTNTTALFSNTAGAALGSRPELRGQGSRVIKRFERLVPFLIAFAGVTLLARGWLQRLVAERDVRQSPRWFTPAGVVAVGVYGGYFGAAAGVLMLAVLSAPAVEPLAVSNAVKNLVTGAANVTAAIGFAFLAPVQWPEAAVLATGCALGSWAGPAVVRRVPETPLRIAIGLAACALAAVLWLGS